MSTRHSFVAIICDPRYKLKLLLYCFEADGGEQSTQYKKEKAHMENIYSRYQQHVVAKAERVRIQEEDLAHQPEEEDEDAWIHDPFYGYTEHVVIEDAGNVADIVPLNTEL